MSQTFNISLPESLVKKMDSYAKQNYMSRSELIRTAVLKELKNHESEWETVVDFTKLDKKGADIANVLGAINNIKSGR